MIQHLSIATRLAILITLIASSVILFTNTSMALDEVNTTFFGVAIKGYDTVAYHTEGRAVKGKSKFSHKWNDAKWYFSSSENKELFAADPERYAPQYGGYWARSLSTTGKAAGVNPKAFKIIDGKLYLNWSAESAEKFKADASENIQKADTNWNKLIDKR